MKRLLTLLVAAGLVAGAATIANAHEAHKHGAEKSDTKAPAKAEKGKSADTDVILQGEILDMACYMPNQEKGPKHASCAKACVKGGAPAGLLLKDGRVLLLIANHANEKAFDAVKDLAGEIVSVKGDIIKRGGMTAVMVESAEKVK